MNSWLGDLVAPIRKAMAKLETRAPAYPLGLIVLEHSAQSLRPVLYLRSGIPDAAAKDSEWSTAQDSHHARSSPSSFDRASFQQAVFD
jgi:hypothetical protein